MNRCSTATPTDKRQEPGDIPRSGSSLGMRILVGSSLQFNLEGAVGRFVAMGHVAASAVGLSRVHCRGGIVELALGNKHIDLGQPVCAVEREIQRPVFFSCARVVD